MSLLKANAVQLGQSLTASQNFTWYQPASPDGTVRLGNGNSGSVTDLITVGSTGNLTFANSISLSAASTRTLTLNGGAGSNGLVIDANNCIGVGISPASSAFKLDVGGINGTNLGIRSTGASDAVIRGYVNGTESATMRFVNGGGLYWEIAGTRQLTLDASGNLGLGVTPSAWNLGPAMQVGGASIFGYNNQFISLSNAYYNGGYKYVASAAATQYAQTGGQHQWLTAASGTAGNAITFTQAMTLDASGNLIVGTTSNPIAATGRTVTYINGSSESLLGFGIGGSTTAYIQSQSASLNIVSAGIGMNISATGANSITFNTNSLSRMGVGSSGVVNITNLAGSGSRAVNADASGNLSAASDSSLKQEDKGAPIPGLKEILKITPRAYKWLADIENRGDEAATEIGFFADEVAPIIPSAAPKCADGLYGFYDRSVTAALVKAIQELSAELNELKQRIK